MKFTVDAPTRVHVELSYPEWHTAKISGMELVAFQRLTNGIEETSHIIDASKGPGALGHVVLHVNLRAGDFVEIG